MNEAYIVDQRKKMCVGRLQVILCTTLVSLSSQMRQLEKSGQTLPGTPALEQTVKMLFQTAIFRPQFMILPSTCSSMFLVICGKTQAKSNAVKLAATA